MTSTELKAEVYQLIDRLDEPFLKVVHSMLGTYVQQQEDPIVGYDIDGTPRTASELTAILEAEIEAVQRGEYVTIEEFQETSAQWGKHTR